VATKKKKLELRFFAHKNQSEINKTCYNCNKLIDIYAKAEQQQKLLLLLLRCRRAIDPCWLRGTCLCLGGREFFFALFA